MTHPLQPQIFQSTTQVLFVFAVFQTKVSLPMRLWKKDKIDIWIKFEEDLMAS